MLPRARPAGCTDGRLRPTARRQRLRPCAWPPGAPPPRPSNRGAALRTLSRGSRSTLRRRGRHVRGAAHELCQRATMPRCDVQAWRPTNHLRPGSGLGAAPPGCVALVGGRRTGGAWRMRITCGSGLRGAVVAAGLGDHEEVLHTRDAGCECTRPPRARPSGTERRGTSQQVATCTMTESRYRSIDSKHVRGSTCALPALALATPARSIAPG